MFFIIPILSIIHCFLITNAHPYNILFVKGSQIQNDFYSPFLQKLQTELETQNFPQKPTVKIGEYFPTSPPEPSSIIVGHSFGGYFGLLQAIQYPEQIKACILINSHFNQRMKMPYLPIALDKVTQPTLVLLNQQDEKLPISKAMDDYHVYRHPSLPQSMTDPRKEFRVRQGTHFSSFINPAQIQETVDEIQLFLLSLDPPSRHTTPPEPPFTYYPSYSTPQIDGKAKRDVLDRLCEWKFPNTRTYYHLPTFLASKPGLFQCLYHPGNLYKTRNFHEEQLMKELTREILVLFPHTKPTIEFKKSYLPLGIQYSNIQVLRNSLFPYSLTQWMSKEPQIQYSTTPSPHLVVELLVMPIIDNIVYYKLPSKLRFLEIN